MPWDLFWPALAGLTAPAVVVAIYAWLQIRQRQKENLVLERDALSPGT